MRLSAKLFVASVALQPVAATFVDWSRAPSFSCPKNTDNKCNDQEKSGWDFGSLAIGSFNTYSSFSFDGFSCKDSKSKRDFLSKRGNFGGKAISGIASKSKGPTFSCGKSSDNRFSIEKYYVSVERDADVEFHYSMPDGSKCSHVTPCQKSGTVVENRQCGGAQSVSFQLPKHEKEDCGIDIHGIDFDCSPPQQPPPKQTSSQQPSPPEKSEAPSAPSPKPPKYSPAGPEVPPSSAVQIPSYSSGSPAVSEKPSASAPTSYSGPKGSSITGPVASSGVAPSGAESSPPVPSSTCPDVLPKCLSTWTFSSTCNGNTDKDCFCKEEKLIASVYECLSAWGETDVEIQAAITYLVGLCGEYIDRNPGLITNCPSSIPIKPTPPPGVSNAQQQPITIITVSQTLTIPYTYSEGSSKGEVTSTESTIQTVVTVPQVAFTTGASGVTLVHGQSANPTGTYSAATTLATGRPQGNATASPVPEQFLGAAPRMVVSWIAGSIALVAGVVFSL